MKEYKIYIIEYDKKAIYVGCTGMDLEERFSRHATVKKSTLFEIINEKGRENFDIIEMGSTKDKKEAFDLEYTLTKYMVETMKMKLLNKCYGNKPMEGYHFTDEQKEKMCNSHKKTKVYCEETDKIYKSLGEASKELNLNLGNISKVLSGVIKQTGGYHFKKVA